MGQSLSASYTLALPGRGRTVARRRLELRGGRRQEVDCGTVAARTAISKSVIGPQMQPFSGEL